jgi:hypothetical protein
MCDCRKAFNAAGKAAAGDKYRRTVMVETISKDGETCDYCGYYIFKDYGNPREAAARPETAIKRKTQINDWHKQDD